MKTYDSAQPYIAAVLALKQDGKYALLKRKNTDWMNGYYGMPGGKVEKGEGFEAAIIREASEEVGITIAPDDLELVLMMWRREADTPENEWCDAIFVAKHWQGEPHNAEPHMHDELVWYCADQLPEHTIPATKSAIAAIEEGKRYAERDEIVAK